MEEGYIIKEICTVRNGQCWKMIVIIYVTKSPGCVCESTIVSAKVLLDARVTTSNASSQESFIMIRNCTRINSIRY